MELWGPFLPVLVVLWLLYRVYRFAVADCDGALKRLGKPPLEAFHNKIVWITGASQGIGEMLAIELARLGAKLIISSRREEQLQQVKARCQDRSGKPAEVEVLPLDLAKGSALIHEAVSKAEAFFGAPGIDYVIHNAAYPRPKMTCEETSEDYTRAMFEINVFAPIELTRACMPGMRKREKGHFVLISSAAGKVPAPTQGVYAASKHAVNGYFNTLRYELLVVGPVIGSAQLIGTGIGVTVICPGPIGTTSPQTVEKDSKAREAADKEEAAKDDRMTTKRCVDLILTAAAHKVPEAWPSTQPVLMIMYVTQFWPWIGHRLMEKIGPRRVAALRSGEGNMYGMNLLVGKRADAKKVA